MCLKSKYICLIVLFLCPVLPARAQESFRILFWNVENLFDTKDNPRKNDDEFLPDATRHWTPYRYREKLKKLAKVIVASGEGYVPDLVGLCEVENDTCMRDLIRFSPLKEAGYRYVMTRSPDERGINVALLYQRGSFKLLHSQSIAIPYQEVGGKPTRDILHATGRVVSGDTLDVMVCHMPSRSGGTGKTEPFRCLTARVLRQAVDSLMQVRRHPHVLIMGDFNDAPTGKPMAGVLGAMPSDGQVEATRLYNLMHGLEEGTYRYRGGWETFDQFVVSGSVLGAGGMVRCPVGKARILRHPFLLEEDDRYGGDRPFRTYNGLKYQGGFSDHLPIALDLEILLPR